MKSVASGHWPGPAQARAWFATASMDGSTRVWRLTDPDPGGRIPAVLTCAATLDGHTAGVRAVAMPSLPRDRHRRAPKDPDARSPRPLVATASYDRSVRLWHGARDAPPFPPLEGHADYVFAAAFTPDGEWIVTGGADGRVCAWRASDADANANANANAAPPKPDDDAPPSKTDPYPRPSSRHARASPSLTVETGAGAVRSVAVAAAAEADATRSLAVSGGEDGQIRVFARDERGGATCELVLAGHAGAITGLALCPPHGETSTVSGSGSGFGSFRVVAGCDDGVLGAWRFTSRTPTSSSSGVPTSSSRVPTSSSGVPTFPPDVALEMACRAHARGAVRATLVVAADARILASSSEDKTARLWCLQTGACLSALVGARAAVETVCFSPCGAYLALGAADGSLSVWRDVAREPPGDDEKPEDLVDATSGRMNETSIEARIEARLDAGMRVLLAPHDPDAECARERDAGTPVDAAAVAGAREAAMEDALGLLPRVDAEAAALVGKLAGAGAGGLDSMTWSARGNPEVPCSVCRGRVELTGASSRAEERGEDGEWEWAMPLPCGHAFHARGCLVPWLRQHTTCPLCRKRVFDGGGEAPVACLTVTR